MTRITMIVPETRGVDVNHTHVLLDKATALNTYSVPVYEDAGGNRYFVSSGPWTDEQIADIKNAGFTNETKVRDKLTDQGGIVDKTRAAGVQTSMRAWDGKGATPKASLTLIRAFPSTGATEARTQIAESGLTPISTGI